MANIYTSKTDYFFLHLVAVAHLLKADSPNKENMGMAITCII